MFNNNLKKEALKIHEGVINRYNESYKIMKESCDLLYKDRIESIELIQSVQNVINSIANTPKNFDTELGEIVSEISKFRETESYAKEAYKASLKAGTNLVGGAALGLGIASMGPTALMSFATTFGTSSTGVAISSLSGAAAQKAAEAWLGRTFLGFAIKSGVGMSAGQALLAFSGPISWGLLAATTSKSLISLTKKNKEIANKAVEEAKEIEIARGVAEEITEKVNALKHKTISLKNNIDEQIQKLIEFKNRDFKTLDDDDKIFLGTIVNKTLSLSVLLNEIIL